MDDALSEQLSDIKIDHNGNKSHYINNYSQTVKLLLKADKIGSLTTKLKGSLLIPFLMLRIIISK